MSIFTTLPALAWTPIVTTAAPMTAVLTANSVATRYGIFGGWCFFSYNVSITIGGVLAAQVINLSFPVQSSIVVNSIAHVSNGFNGGVSNIIRGGIQFTNQQIFIIKSNGVNDVAWAAGASVFVGNGFYPLY